MKTKIIFISAFLFALLVSCPAQNTSSIDAFKNSKHRITLDKAKVLKSNHDNKIKPVINALQNTRIQREKNFETTQYVWISLDDIKMYIQMLESVAEKNQKPISGIAINFGAYDDNQVFSQNDLRKGDYRGRIGIFMNPTYYMDGANDPQDIANHKQFYINPTNPTTNEFVGSYIPIENWKDLGMVDYIKKSVMGGGETEFTEDNIINGGTSLAMDELMSIPPNKF